MYEVGEDEGRGWYGVWPIVMSCAVKEQTKSAADTDEGKKIDKRNEMSSTFR